MLYLKAEVAQALPGYTRRAAFFDAAARKISAFDIALLAKNLSLPINAGRLPGLDGLRAIAIIAVLLFHADFYWARGGYLGVDLFFVISGFLITSLLANEMERSGGLHLSRFYWRRAKRLLPASWLMTASVVAASALCATDALPRLRSDAIATFVYLTNWELLRTHASYFESAGRMPLLQHLWSLAIEEQFYIVWAPLVSIALPRIGRAGLAVAAILLAVASATWMAIQAMKIGYPEHGDPSRLYFGTDTHGFPLLLGAALGLAWQPGRVSRTLRPAIRSGVLLLGLLALTMMLVLFVRLGEATGSLYPWGFALAAEASIVLVISATHPGTAFGRWLDCGPLRWLGERSYGVYLWHWPIFMLLRPGMDLRGLDANTILLLRLVLTISIAALSYHYLEMPIRRGALERVWRDMCVAGTCRRAWLRGSAIAATLLLAVSATAAVLWEAPARAEPAQDVRDALHLDLNKPSPVVMAAATLAALTPVPPPALAAVPGQPAPKTFTGHELTAVGDSVLLGASWLLKLTLHDADVHATMGWQAADIIKKIKALRGAGKLRPVVLVHLGTNGYVTEDQLRQILTILVDRQRVVLVNTHVPRRWMEANNALVERIAPNFPNVLTVRWSEVSEGQPDYFVSDGVHLSGIGQRVFVAEIMRVGRLFPDVEKNVPGSVGISEGKDYARGAGDLSPTLVRAPQPAAPDTYWKKLASCETDANWQNPGRHSGGLGITPENWKTWGGTLFAPQPAAASTAQQIEVANRISTQGWKPANGSFVKPIGFAVWRCVAALGRPPTASDRTYTPESVIAQSFHLGERGDVVRDLQLTLGVPRDGLYTKGLRKKHLAYLKKNSLPETRAGTFP